jgi:DNA-binding CsgD family transcriptional regulator
VAQGEPSTLTLRDVDALAGILPELYAVRDIDGFLEASLPLLERVIPVDQSYWLGYAHATPLRLTTCIGRTAELLRPVRDRLAAGLPTHPFVRRYASTGIRGALMSSDFQPDDWREHRESFEDVYTAARLNHLLGVPVHDERGLLALNLVREHQPFAERDRACLNWLHPHLEQALRNASVWALATSEAAAFVDALADHFRLTPREAQVAFWLSQAKTNHEIGLILNIAPRTVEKHIEHVLKTLAVENRTAAALAVGAAVREIAGRPRSKTTADADGWQVFDRTRNAT